MKVLVVVDMQNDFIDGSLGTPEAQAIVPNVKKKIDEAILNKDFIIYTRDTHREDYLESREGQKLPVNHCIRDTHGWEIPDELLPRINYANAAVMNKTTFGSTRLPNVIKEHVYMPDVTEIELIGLCTDICVVSNALILKAYFYEDCEISVDANCCAGVTPESHEAALKTMEMCQIVVNR